MIGRIAKFRYIDGVVVDGVVVGYDYNRGISIVSEEDPERHLICLHGPDSADSKEHDTFYDEFFEYITEHVNSDSVIDAEELLNKRSVSLGLSEEEGLRGHIAPCPFE